MITTFTPATRIFNPTYLFLSSPTSALRFLSFNFSFFSSQTTFLRFRHSVPISSTPHYLNPQINPNPSGCFQSDNSFQVMSFSDTIPPHGTVHEDFVDLPGQIPYIHSDSNLNPDSDFGFVSGGDEGFGNGVGEKDLRDELPRSVLQLCCESTAEGADGRCEVYLVGTAHVSKESCRDVRAVISSLKPQVIFLELCSSRMAVLTPQNLKVPTMHQMLEMWKKQHNLFEILYSWFLAKVASKLEVFPGSEFRVAYEEAKKYGAKVILGDRPVHITLRRTWAKMPLWHKAKLVYFLLFQGVFLPNPDNLNKMLREMNDVDVLTLVIQEMSKEFPTLMETLVHERDQYMSSKLLKAAEKHSSIVAVVGKGHLQGIKKHWKQPVKLSDLLGTPAPKKAMSGLKMLAALGVAVGGVAAISGIYLSNRK